MKGSRLVLYMDPGWQGLKGSRLLLYLDLKVSVV